MTAFRTQYKDPDVSALAKDVQDALRPIVARRVLSFESQYREPMYLALPSAPAGIYAMRIRGSSAPETVVAHGTRVSFTWLGERGVRIDDIEGMTPGATKYLFDLEVVG